VTERINKSEEEWRALLPAERFHILREAGTEPAFTGIYWDKDDEGLYRCGACGNPLFRSDAKFESGTGWPSFFEPVGDEAIETRTDASGGRIRTEVRCARCGSHLGHVFADASQPTGLRY